jgi:hypothetical protein
MTNQTFKLMKKIFLFVAVVSAFSLASCKKDRTCTCVSSNSDGSPGDTYIVTIKDAKKSDSKKACINQTYTEPGNTTTVTCTVK